MVLVRGTASWATHSLAILLLLLPVSSAASASDSVKMNQNDAIALEELSIQSMLKEEIKMAVAGRKRGHRLHKEDMQKAQNYSHPIFKPGIVDESKWSLVIWRHHHFNVKVFFLLVFA